MTSRTFETGAAGPAEGYATSGKTPGATVLVTRLSEPTPAPSESSPGAPVSVLAGPAVAPSWGDIGQWIRLEVSSPAFFGNVAVIIGIVIAALTSAHFSGTLAIEIIAGLTAIETVAMKLDSAFGHGKLNAVLRMRGKLPPLP